MEDNEITLKVLLDHIQGMRNDLTQRMDKLEHRLSNRMDGLEKRMDGMEQRMEKRFDQLVFQIDAIDKRLDAVEIEELPKRVTKLEEAVLAS
ncbi:hypothetical protein KKF55_00115 [Patescibacteria group bacterium]|nr:hypothetical protein [Patescibacteria group bacterium]